MLWGLTFVFFGVAAAQEFEQVVHESEGQRFESG